MDEIYYKEDNKVYKIKVERDDYSLNPRKDYSNLAHMMCWHRDYILGDENPFKSPDEFIDELIRQEYPEKSIINFVKNKKTNNDLELKYDRKEQMWMLIGNYTVWWNNNKIHRGELASNQNISWLYDDILDAMSMSDKIKLLEKKGYYFCPVSIYDHSGITMYIGNPSDHFDGRWDCSREGYIYIKKDEVFDSGCQIKGKSGRYIKTTKRNWKQVAYQICESEVEVYDMYLVGDVYFAILSSINKDDIDKDDIEDSCWNEEETCGSFFSRKYGTDLLYEVAGEFTATKSFYNSISELVA